MGDDKVVQLFPKWQAIFEERFTEGSESERRLWRAIHNDDDLGFILRVHLLFESELNTVLQRKGKPPGPDDGFATKLKTASRAGLISEPLGKTIFAINDLRNKYAHELDYMLTDEYSERIFQLAVISADAEDDFSDARSRLRATIAWIWNAFQREVDPENFYAEAEALKHD